MEGYDTMKKSLTLGYIQLLPINTAFRQNAYNYKDILFNQRINMTLVVFYIMVSVIISIIKKSDGSTKVLYGDIDSKPMFVSFSAYKTEEEASEECKTIIEHVKDYKDAEYSKLHYNIILNYLLLS